MPAEKPPIVILEGESNFEQWRDEIFGTLAIYGIPRNAFDTGAFMRGDDHRVFVKNLMMNSLHNFFPRLEAIGWGSKRTDEQPKLLFEVIKGFIVEDATNEFKQLRPRDFITWADYLARAVHLKRRLNELGMPMNNKLAATFIDRKSVV